VAAGEGEEGSFDAGHGRRAFPRTGKEDLGSAKGLERPFSLASLLLGVCLESEGVEGDKAGGVVLVVGFLLAAFHGGDVFVVHGVGTATASLHDVAFVEFEADFTGDGFLGLCNEGLDGLALGGEPEAVVNELGVFRDEGVAGVLELAVDDEGFQIAVCGEQDGAAGGLVDAAGFHPDEAVLDDVDPADAVGTAEGVEHAHDAVWGEDGIAVLFALDLEVAELCDDFGKSFGLEADDVALFEEDLEHLWFVWGFFWGDGEHIHVAIGLAGGIVPGVFESAGLEGDVEEVAVHGVGLFHGGFDRDVVSLGVFDHFLAARELFAEFYIAPWGYTFDTGGEGCGGEFEAHLVVAFACCSVGDGVGSFLEGDVDHAFGDTWAGDGGAEKVAAFIDSVRLEHGEDVVAGELFLLIVDVALGCTGGEGFCLKAVEFVALAAIGAVCDDLSVVFFFEPEEEDGGIKASGVCDDDFHKIQFSIFNSQ